MPKEPTRIEKPPTINTPDDCRALATWEWENETTPEQRTGDREAYISQRAASFEQRFLNPKLTPAPSPIAPAAKEPKHDRSGPRTDG